MARIFHGLFTAWVCVKIGIWAPKMVAFLQVSLKATLNQTDTPTIVGEENPDVHQRVAITNHSHDSMTSQVFALNQKDLMARRIKILCVGVER